MLNILPPPTPVPEHAIPYYDATFEVPPTDEETRAQIIAIWRSERRANRAFITLAVAVDELVKQAAGLRRQKARFRILRSTDPETLENYYVSVTVAS
jgi:hypothetical protein